MNEKPGICAVCGGPAPASERCTNNRCAKCHPTYCTPGGGTSPGHRPLVFDVAGLPLRERHMFTLEEIHEADDLQAGYCLSCGAMRECCEPDARNYPCEECGEEQVFGAQELVIMGRVT